MDILLATLAGAAVSASILIPISTVVVDDGLYRATSVHFSKASIRADCKTLCTTTMEDHICRIDDIAPEPYTLDTLPPHGMQEVEVKVYFNYYMYMFGAPASHQCRKFLSDGAATPAWQWKNNCQQVTSSSRIKCTNRPPSLIIYVR